MRVITKLADRVVARMVPQKPADACVPPDCFTQRCCYNCTGKLICS